MVKPLGLDRCLFFFFDSKHFFGTKAAKSSRLLLFQGRACSVHWSFSAHRGESQVSHQQQPKSLGSQFGSITKQIFFKNIDMKKSHWKDANIYQSWNSLTLHFLMTSQDFCWGIRLYNCDCVVRWLQHPIASNFGIERLQRKGEASMTSKRILKKKSVDEFWSSYTPWN